MFGGTTKYVKWISQNLVIGIFAGSEVVLSVRLEKMLKYPKIKPYMKKKINNYIIKNQYTFASLRMSMNKSM